MPCAKLTLVYLMYLGYEEFPSPRRVSIIDATSEGYD